MGLAWKFNNAVQFFVAGSAFTFTRRPFLSNAILPSTGRDWTLFALVDGKIAFDKNGRRVNVKAEPAAKN